MSTWHVEFRDGRNGNYEAKAISPDSDWLYLYDADGALMAAFPKDIVLSAERMAARVDDEVTDPRSLGADPFGPPVLDQGVEMRVGQGFRP